MTHGTLSSDPTAVARAYQGPGTAVPPLPPDVGFASALELAGDAAEVAGFDWSFIDQAYCLSLRSRLDRRGEVLDALASVGLLSRTTFVLSDPSPPPRPPAIFHSHRGAAIHAYGAGYRRVLILEDDVAFHRLTPARLARIVAQVDGLPPGWFGFFLGHFPLRAYFIGAGVLRSSSGCSHAYVASDHLIDWLRHCDPKDPAIPRDHLVGQGIDAALACVPRMYATFPMVAVQSRSPSSNINARITNAGQPRSIFNRYWWTPVLLRGMRVAEMMVVVLSPLHRLRRGLWAAEYRPEH
jgi:hypothetical protein